MIGEPELNPAQREVVELLGAPESERPRFDAGLRHELRAELEHELAPLVDQLDAGDQLYVSKHKLAQVHGCEARYLAGETEPFAWSVPIARGTVAHKAIELGISWRGEPVPTELVDESLARLAQGSDSLGDFLRTCGEADRAELRGQATDRVTTFFECFPPLKPVWRPVPESKVRVELLDARVVLSGKIDLSMGRANGTTAGKVLIDLKTGGFAPAHLDDLRFYALLESIKIGTPPRLLASYYLEEGRPHAEAVSEGLLHAALARTVDGAARMIELRAATRTPTKRTGPPCRWCPILASCAEGTAWCSGDDPERFDADADDT